MPRTTLSQDIDALIQGKRDFHPEMRIPMETVWDWHERVKRMERTISRLRTALRAAGGKMHDEDGCA